jgi:hypothetical protein
MLFKKLLLITLIAGSTCQLNAITPHEIRMWGIVVAGILGTSYGLHVLTRQNYDLTHKIFDLFVGLPLIGVGLYAIVMGDKISAYLERQFH